VFNEEKGFFTLIELLIVVAIIAILAAIAIPNFMEAQVRSKVSRAKADMRTIATALESYFVDKNHYPDDVENGWPYYLTRQLSTPQPYLSNSKLYDPFVVTGFRYNQFDIYDYPKRFRFWNEEAEINQWPALGPLYPGVANRPAITDGGGLAAHQASEELWGVWRLASNGPDKVINWSSTPPNALPNILIYDPTNGTYSLGDIFRTQRQPDATKSRN